MAILLEPAGWGLAGALIYAAPRLSACMFTSHRHKIGRCLFEFGLSLVIGAVASAAFGPWAQTALNRSGERDLNAICAMIGLLANPTAPKLIDGLGALAINAINGNLWKLLSQDKGKAP